MPTIHDDYLTVHYEPDEGELVVKNESSKHPAEDVAIQVGGVPFDQHQGIGVGPGYDRTIDIAPEKDFRVPMERTKEGPSESYTVELTYTDENNDEHTSLHNIHL